MNKQYFCIKNTHILSLNDVSFGVFFGLGVTLLALQEETSAFIGVLLHEFFRKGFSLFLHNTMQVLYYNNCFSQKYSKRRFKNCVASALTKLESLVIVLHGNTG